MKIFILILLLAALIQTSFLPVNLCLLILICRSFTLYAKNNLTLALITGLILGILSPVNLGFWPLIFLIVVFITHLIRKLPVTTGFTIIPAAFVLILLVSFIESIFLKQQINIKTIILSTLLSFPIFLTVKLWEERFVPNSEIKLKLKK